MAEQSTKTGHGSCKVCGVRKQKILKKVYLDGSMHFVDEHGKSWNSSTCPECYSAKRKIKRKQHTPKLTSCAQCGKEFMTKSKIQRFCSKDCQKRFNNDSRSIVKDTPDKDAI